MGDSAGPGPNPGTQTVLWLKPRKHNLGTWPSFESYFWMMSSVSRPNLWMTQNIPGSHQFLEMCTIVI